MRALLIMLAVSLGCSAGHAQQLSFREQAKEAAQRGENTQAVALFESALSSASKVFNEDDIELTIRRAELGDAYRAVGRWEEAITQLDFAWKRFRYDADQQKRWSQDEGMHAMNCAEKLARACQAAGLYGDSLMVLNQALLDNRKQQRSSEEAVHFMALLADAQLLLKKDNEAAESLKQASSLTEQNSDNDPRRLAQVYSVLGGIYERHNRLELASPFYQRAMQVAAQHFPPDDPERAQVQQQLGWALLHEGKLAEAEMLFRDALRNLSRKHADDSLEFLKLRFALCELALRQNNLKTAETQLNAARGIISENVSEEHPDNARYLLLEGKVFAAKGNADAARKSVLKALQVSAKTLGEDHPDTTLARDTLRSMEKKKP